MSETGLGPLRRRTEEMKADQYARRFRPVDHRYAAIVGEFVPKGNRGRTRRIIPHWKPVSHDAYGYDEKGSMARINPVAYATTFVSIAGSQWRYALRAGPKRPNYVDCRCEV